MRLLSWVYSLPCMCALIRRSTPQSIINPSRRISTALVIDNADGEVLALEQNQIHAHQSPVEHGEQRVLRAAIARLAEKRPRDSATTVEDYYRRQLFYGDGLEEADFLNNGATIYTSLEPCPMCATTILVCRVKRAVFLLQDHTYGGAWITIKKTFYDKYDLSYGQSDLSKATSPLIQRAHDIKRYDRPKGRSPFTPRMSSTRSSSTT